MSLQQGSAINLLPQNAAFVPSGYHCAPLDTDTISESSQGEGFPFERHTHIPSRIVGLLLMGRPAAVFRLVPPFVINSIKRGFGWTGPHVDQESGEGQHPPFANDDAATAPEMILRVLRVRTSRFHCAPRTILGRGFFSSTRPMLHFGRSRPLSVKAATAQGVPAAKVATARNSVPATLATALPLPLPVPFGGFRRNCQPSELLPV